jgi:hypothetical protein
MVAKYSSKLVEAVRGAEGYKMGLDLAKVCIDANLPALYVSQVLGVTRMTLHNWFRGGAVRPARRERIELFMELVEGDMKSGVLPAKTLADARAYLQEMMDTPLKTTAKEKQD